MNTAVMQVRCPNPKCGRIFLNSDETFCPECGTRLPAAASVQQIAEPIQGVQGATHATAFTVAGKGSRAIGFLIDCLVASLILPLLFVPVAGQIAAGLIWAVYFFFRDINGASIGKLILGNMVVSKTGRPASNSQKLLRNVLLVLPDIAEWIPIAGLAAGPTVFLIILCVEGFFLVTTGERIGDRLAGTMVVKRVR